MRIVRALIVGCALLVPAGLAAQDPSSTSRVHPPIAPSHLAAARELLDVLHLQDVAAAGVQVSIDEQLRTNPALEPYRTVMKEWAAGIFAGDEAKNAFATIYAETFSEADLRQLVAFYRTPLGQKLANSQAALTVRGAEVGHNLATAHQADLMARIQAMQPKP